MASVQKILMTGSNGNIGSILRERLTCNITPYDLPDFDVCNYDQLCKNMKDHDAVIHLAWDQRIENYKTNLIEPRNYLMCANVLRAAEAMGVRRVILASSIHADTPQHEPGGERSPYRLPEPDSGYGATKVGMEALARFFSKHYPLEVICIRFGWVDKHIAGPPAIGFPPHEAWLSYRDLASLLRACLEAQQIPDNYVVMYGVSKRNPSVHSLENPFGWQPQDVYQA